MLISTISKDLFEQYLGVPKGSYLVDADALRKARAGVPAGEYHRVS